MSITLDGSAGISGATTGTFSGNVTANGLSTELRPLVLGTSQASTSGTVIDFTGIPSWVKRVTVMLSGVSASGASNLELRLGTSGGVEATGYSGTTSAIGGVSVGSSLHSTGFLITQGTAGSSVRSGSIALVNISGNVWVANGVTGNSDGARTDHISGSKSLGGTLDRIRITTVNGTDTFDAGTINIMYE